LTWTLLTGDAGTGRLTGDAATAVTASPLANFSGDIFYFNTQSASLGLPTKERPRFLFQNNVAFFQMY
jgi:hypothetical protein